MTIRIGLISDVHASPDPLREALDIFKHERVDEIICIGDIAGYFDDLKSCVALLQRHRCKTVIGNHDEQILSSTELAGKSAEVQFLGTLPRFLQFEFKSVRLYVVHAQPPDATHGGIKLLDQHGDIIIEQKRYWQNRLKHFAADVLIVGHTHQVYAEKLDSLLVVNPGSVPFNHSCMILTLPDCTVQTFALSGKPIIKSWNFGRLFQGDEPYPVQ